MNTITEYIDWALDTRPEQPLTLRESLAGLHELVLEAALDYEHVTEQGARNVLRAALDTAARAENVQPPPAPTPPAIALDDAEFEQLKDLMGRVYLELTRGLTHRPRVNELSARRRLELAGDVEDLADDLDFDVC